jgi:hypothetical protein
VRFVLLDGNVTLLGVLDVQRGDLSAFYFHRRRVLAFMVDVVVTILFELVAYQLLRVMMVLRLSHHRDGDITDDRESENGNDRRQRTRHEIILHC